MAIASYYRLIIQITALAAGIFMISGCGFEPGYHEILPIEGAQAEVVVEAPPLEAPAPVIETPTTSTGEMILGAPEIPMASPPPAPTPSPSPSPSPSLQSSIRVPGNSLNAQALDQNYYQLTIPFESDSAVIEFNQFNSSIPQNATITKVGVRIHQYADEQGQHFYGFQILGVRDIVAELVSGSSAISANEATMSKIKNWSSSSGLPLHITEYTFLESQDGSSVISANTLNASDLGIRLQYHNEYYKSNYATVYIDKVELLIEYH